MGNSPANMRGQLNFLHFSLFGAGKKLLERHNVPICGVSSGSTPSDTGVSAHLGGGPGHDTQVKIHWGLPHCFTCPKDRHSPTHNSKAPLSCQWSSGDKNNHELTSWWGSIKFWIIGKKYQNAGEGKQKRATAVKTIPDSTYERVLRSLLMTFLWHLTFLLSP